jgi:hypothetical protein
MNFPLTQPFAWDFAREWVAAWNSHDLERVLAHYSADVELASPYVRRILGGEVDTVRGISALREYFSRALVKVPDLTFALKYVYFGERSVLVQYERAGMSSAAEFMEFDESGRVCRVRAHYSAEVGAF